MKRVHSPLGAWPQVEMADGTVRHVHPSILSDWDASPGEDLIDRKTGEVIFPAGSWVSIK